MESSPNMNFKCTFLWTKHELRVLEVNVEAENVEYNKHGCTRISLLHSQVGVFRGARNVRNVQTSMYERPSFKVRTSAGLARPLFTAPPTGSEKKNPRQRLVEAETMRWSHPWGVSWEDAVPLEENVATSR